LKLQSIDKIASLDISFVWCQFTRLEIKIKAKIHQQSTGRWKGGEVGGVNSLTQNLFTN